MNPDLSELKEYIESLQSQSFEGWNEDQINGYMTACESIKRAISNTEKL